jgi:hypothetical protein
LLVGPTQVRVTLSTPELFRGHRIAVPSNVGGGRQS